MDEIKSDLRELTEQTRRLRKELQKIVDPSTDRTPCSPTEGIEKAMAC